MTSNWAQWRRCLPSGSTKLFGIIGAPLEHSLSPSVQTAVLRSLGIDGVYLPVPVGPSQIRAFFALAPAMGFVGVNVTTPFKEVAARHVELRDRESERTRMVNTVEFRPRRRKASSARGGAGKDARPLASGTDGAGIRGWLETHVPSGAPVGILGFGPTARSLLHQLWWKDPRRPVSLVSRRPGIASRALAEWPRCGRGAGRLVGSGPRVSSWDDLPSDVEVWISTLPPETPVPESFWSVAAGTRLLDMNYGESRTGLVAAARERGLVAADGLGPLLCQAALSLSIWLDRDIDPELYRQALGVSRRRLGLHA